MEQMYNIVADVDKYSEFVPWCKKSRVINKQGEASAQADLTVGFPPIVESYRSNLTLKKPELVMSVCADGKLFETLITTWKFSPGVVGNSQSCTLKFSVSINLTCLASRFVAASGVSANAAFLRVNLC
uniref:Coenzyme Q-binding protein COQ10 START domain-containing protein n=1 Tax=Romanomermis culicivorax TaxID=13658 RepID=A0A915JN48_ROMCU